MTANLTLEQAQQRALDLMKKGYHCGPSVLQVLWEAHGMENEDFLWAGIPFMGGIAGEQDAPCGAVSTGTLFLGLKHRCPLSDKEKAKDARNKARMEALAFAKTFKEKFGAISCMGLIGVDLSDSTAAKQFWDSGKSNDTCVKYVFHAIEMLFPKQ